MSEYLQNLGEAVMAMHDCQCEHKGTSHVHEMIDGKTVWKGEIETFELTEHKEATKAFGWAWEDETGEIRYIAVLNIPPIESPREAVQAAIASGQFR